MVSSNTYNKRTKDYQNFECCLCTDSAESNGPHYFQFFDYVVVQFYPWFKFYFPLFLGMVMYDNKFKAKENKI